jgi:NAD(P)H-hydrate epimerase
MRLVKVAEMRAIEREANQRGVSYEEMMERAGGGVARFIDSIFGEGEKKLVLGLVGSGNNGGDTLVALAALATKGWPACAYLVRARPEDDELVRRVKTAGGEVVPYGKDRRFNRLGDLVAKAAILLDGVLGTGIKLPLDREVEKTLEFVLDHPSSPLVIAIDCPSGVDCDSGQVSPVTIPADITICMEAVKWGLVKFPAFDYVGELLAVDLGLPEDLKSAEGISTFILSAGVVEQLLPPRSKQAHKGTFGTVLVAAGSQDFTGAALLAGEAAYRAGTGLVRMAVPAPLHAALAGQLPEATWLLLPHSGGSIDAAAVELLCANLDKATALLIGPGLGLSESTAGFVHGVLGELARRKVGKERLPALIIDADGLKLAAQMTGWARMLPEHTILTPHPGEMSVLTGLSVAEIQADRIETARKFAREWGQVVVLKGALTVIANPEGRVYIIPVATPALARAGTGDVLAGLIAGYRAQGLAAVESACLGAWVHAQAGLVAAERFGQTASVLAGDVLAAVPEVLKDMESD